MDFSSEGEPILAVKKVSTFSPYAGMRGARRAYLPVLLKSGQLT
jgi:hypothetical protein